MNRCRSRRQTGAALALAGALTSCSAWREVVLWEGVDALDRGDAASGTIAEVHFLGISGVSIRVGADHVLTAPFFSNPGLLRTGLGRIASDRERVLRHSPPVGDVQAVVVGHGHYDHTMDLVPLARDLLPTSAVIFGSRTVKHLLAPARLEQEVRALNDAAATADLPGAWQVLPGGRVRVMAILSDHAPHFLGMRFYEGVLHSDRSELATRAKDWVMGQTLAYLIDFLDDDGAPRFRVYFQDAPADPPSGIPPPLDDGHRIDLAILCVGSFDSVDHHPGAILLATRPRFVLSTHWEGFFRDPAEPPKPLPLTDIREYSRRVDAVLAHDADHALPAPGVRLHLPLAD